MSSGVRSLLFFMFFQVYDTCKSKFYCFNLAPLLDLLNKKHLLYVLSRAATLHTLDMLDLYQIFFVF